MRKQSGRTGVVLLIVTGIVIVAIGAWYIVGRNRIISAVPESAKEGERVILVTPRATPTSEHEPTPTLTDEEQKKADEQKKQESEPTITTKPTATGTPKPTVMSTETPTPSPAAAGSPTGSPTPSVSPTPTGS